MINKKAFCVASKDTKGNLVLEKDAEDMYMCYADKRDAKNQAVENLEVVVEVSLKQEE